MSSSQRRSNWFSTSPKTEAPAVEVERSGSGPTVRTGNSRSGTGRAARGRGRCRASRPAGGPARRSMREVMATVTDSMLRPPNTTRGDRATWPTSSPSPASAQGQLVRRGLPGRLHPPDSRRARLRHGRDALHRPRGVHRLRRLRRGLPGRRLLRRGPAPGRVAALRRDQRGVLREHVGLFSVVRVEAHSATRRRNCITEGKEPPRRRAGPFRWRCPDFTRPCQV